MAGAFFAELGLPHPTISLGVGGGGARRADGRMLVALEPVLVAERPDAVLVYGDTNSTLAGSLAAAKLGIPVAHVEAGLRSFDRRMPEEVNRVVADHLATWCFAPTPTAVANLAAEGITAGVVEVGDLMQDLASRVAAEVRDPDALVPAGDALAAAGAPDLAAVLRPGGFMFATIHRAENREPAALAAWPAILGDAARPRRPVILALHPGTRAALEAAGDHPAARRPGRGAARLPDEPHPPAPRGGRHHRLRRRPARVRVARNALPRAPLDHRVGGGGRRVDRADGRRGAGSCAAVRELDRLAPPAASEALARARADGLRLPPAEASRRIVDALEAGRGS